MKKVEILGIFIVLVFTLQAWCLEQLQGTWNNDKIKNTAQTILTQYAGYSGKIKNSVNDVKANIPTNAPTHQASVALEMKESFTKDEAAKIKLLRLSNL